MKKVSLSTILVLAFIFSFHNLEAKAQVKSMVGFYLQLDNKAYFYDFKTRVKYPLSIAGADAKAAILKLRSNDLISGSFEIVDRKSALLHSIDFVGLKRLLGLWLSDKKLLNFLSYSKLVIKEKNSPTAAAQELNYSIAPSEGDTWKMFVTSDTEIQLGGLELNDSAATLEIYDPDTGETIERIRMKKANR